MEKLLVHESTKLHRKANIILGELFKITYLTKDNLIVNFLI
jgi:hypothetical protein